MSSSRGLDETIAILVSRVCLAICHQQIFRLQDGVVAHLWSRAPVKNFEMEIMLFGGQFLDPMILWVWKPLRYGCCIYANFFMCNQGYHLPQTPYQLFQNPPTCQPCGHIPYLIRGASMSADSCGMLGPFNSPWKPWDSHTLGEGTLESETFCICSIFFSIHWTSETR